MSATLAGTARRAEAGGPRQPDQAFLAQALHQPGRAVQAPGLVGHHGQAVGGADPVALLERLGSRVQLLHIKDGPLSTNDLEQVAVGSGSMPVPAILAAAPQAIRVVELDDFDGDMLTAVADSAAYLVGLGERL